MSGKLRQQMQRLKEIDFYRRRFAAAGIRPDDIEDPADLRNVPFMSRKDLEKDFFEDNPPYGSFFTREITRFNLTPTMSGFLPVYFTPYDLERSTAANAHLFVEAGVTPDDIVGICMNYHIMSAGMGLQQSFEVLGAKVIPLGPGESERAVQIIQRYRVSVLVANPTFAMKLAEMGAKDIRVLCSIGEPLLSVEGLKEKIRSSFNCQISLIESYGISECSPVARECRYENGLHLADDYACVEIIDPETGEPVEEGEKGEIVLTHLDKEAMPLLRYRTGDLTVAEKRQCPCGRHLTLPYGILGRVDQMHKVKGVKLYPSQVTTVAKSVPGLTGKYVIRISRKGGQDYFELILEGHGEFDYDELLHKFKTALIIEPNRLEVVDTIPESGVIDEKQ